MAGQGKTTKKKKGAETQHQPQMKIVTVDTCTSCSSRCARGIQYMQTMKRPGAIGYGVPCILTLK